MKIHSKHHSSFLFIELYHSSSSTQGQLFITLVFSASGSPTAGADPRA